MNCSDKFRKLVHAPGEETRVGPEEVDGRPICDHPGCGKRLRGDGTCVDGHVQGAHPFIVTGAEALEAMLCVATEAVERPNPALQEEDVAVVEALRVQAAERREDEVFQRAAVGTLRSIVQRAMGTGVSPELAELADDVRWQVGAALPIPAVFSGDDVLIRGNVRVMWEDIGEGLSGDYDESDPDDIPLLRFYIDRWNPTDPNGWVEVEDGSFCTQMPTSATPTQRRQGLELLMGRVYENVAAGESLDRAGEELSWISPDDLTNAAARHCPICGQFIPADSPHICSGSASEDAPQTVVADMPPLPPDFIPRLTNCVETLDLVGAWALYDEAVGKSVPADTRLSRETHLPVEARPLLQRMRDAYNVDDLVEYADVEGLGGKFSLEEARRVARAFARAAKVRHPRGSTVIESMVQVLQESFAPAVDIDEQLAAGNDLLDELWRGMEADQVEYDDPRVREASIILGQLANWDNWEHIPALRRGPTLLWDSLDELVERGLIEDETGELYEEVRAALGDESPANVLAALENLVARGCIVTPQIAEPHYRDALGALADAYGIPHEQFEANPTQVEPLARRVVEMLADQTGAQRQAYAAQALATLREVVAGATATCCVCGSTIALGDDREPCEDCGRPMCHACSMSGPRCLDCAPEDV